MLIETIILKIIGGNADQAIAIIAGIICGYFLIMEMITFKQSFNKIK